MMTHLEIDCSGFDISGSDFLLLCRQHGLNVQQSFMCIDETSYIGQIIASFVTSLFPRV